MTHIVLPCEAWADLADPKKVSERKRRPVMRALAALTAYNGLHPDEKTPTEEYLELMDRANDAASIALIERWSFGDQVTLDVLQDLPGDIFDVLRGECLKLMSGLYPNFQVDPDPKEPPTTGS